MLFVLLAASNPAYGPYNATVIKAKDADTITVAVELWPGLVQMIDLRLYGIDTPESRTKNLCEKRQGLQAKEFVKAYIAKHGPRVIVDKVILGKYAGRAVGELIINNVNLSTLLIEKNMARPYFGGTKDKRPWPGCNQ